MAKLILLSHLASVTDHSRVYNSEIFITCSGVDPSLQLFLKFSAYIILLNEMYI